EAENSQDELGVNTGRITIEEVKIAIKSLKNNKADGLEKLGGQAMVEELMTLFNKCWQSGTVPPWRKGTIVKLPEKGNTSECTNWRGITLFSVPGKAFCIVIKGACKESVWTSLSCLKMFHLSSEKLLQF
uniref:Reverse transcriptase domain-containing protein n=1 Tax=Haplochromis burtoni TaxID=8153 RepID=A0A3Q2W2L2_HAPBU